LVIGGAEAGAGNIIIGRKKPKEPLKFAKRDRRADLSDRKKEKLSESYDGDEGVHSVSAGSSCFINLSFTCEKFFHY
jgi:hypothetical protein